MRCIFCLKERAPSDEHVVPTTLGGSLIVTNVCGECNGRLNRNVDEPFKNSDLTKLARMANQLGGRRDNIPNPFAGRHTDQVSGNEIVIRGNRPPYTIPAMVVTPRPGGVELTVTMDPTDEHRFEEIVAGLLKNEIRSRKPELTDEQIEVACTRVLESANFSISRSSNLPRVQSRLAVDINDSARIYAKIGYEIGALVHGDDWVSRNVVAARLRDALVNLDTSAMKVAFATQDPFAPSPGSHLIVVTRNTCYIRLFESPAFVELDELNGDFDLLPENSHCFLLDYVEEKHARMTFAEYVHLVARTFMRAPPTAPAPEAPLV